MLFIFQLGQDGLIKFFSLRFLHQKYGNKHEFAFTNVPFRHNSACIIQKWLKFKRVINGRLAYISSIFPNGSKII